MAVISTIDYPITINAAAGAHTAFPFPSRRWDELNIATANRIYYEDNGGGIGDAAARPNVFYFHGAGSPGFLTGPLVQAVIDAGYNFINCMYFYELDGGTGELIHNPPYKYGYGSVSAPMYTQNNLKLAAWVSATIREITAVGLTGDAVILGHSMGASAALCFGSYGVPSSGFRFSFVDLALDYSDYCVEIMASGKLKGMLLNAATMGATGGKSWNDVGRNINSFTNMIPFLKPRTIMSYGDLDTLATPDYVRYLQASVPSDKEVYVLSAGNRGHDWINSDIVSAGVAVDWITQLFTGAPILALDGSPAVAGPHAP